MTDEQFGRAKNILRENDCPFFSDEDLQFYYQENNCDFNEMIYNCLIVKAQDTSLQVTGLSLADTSKYFLRLAQKYRKNNSGTLRGC